MRDQTGVAPNACFASWLPRVMLLHLVCLALTGCASIPTGAAEQVRQADRAYRLADYTQSERLTSAVIDQHPGEQFTAEALYLRGLTRIRQDRRREAERDLERALSLCRADDLETLVLIQLGNLAFDDEAYGRAAQCLGRVVDDLPTGVPVDTLWYRYALSLQRSGDFEQARLAFAQLIARRPDSTLMPAARRRMQWRSNHFTIQCGAFSEQGSARAAAENLRKAGVDASVVAQDHRAAVPFVVHAGRYRDFPQAQAALPSVRNVQRNAFIVP